MDIINSNSLIKTENTILKTENPILKKINKIIIKNNINKDNNIFIELCKIESVKNDIIKYYLNNENLIKDNIKEGYEYIYEHFKKNINIENAINKIKLFLKYLNEDDITLLKNEINIKLNEYINNKNIYSFLKTFYINVIKINKKKDYNKKIDSILKAITKTNNNKRIIFYINKILIYLKKSNTDINYENIINTFNILLIDENILKNNNSDGILNIIHICKKELKNNILKKNITSETYNENELESILISIDNNLYDYFYFLKNDDKLILDKDKSLSFLSKFNYNNKSFKDIDNLSLKRGFITGLTKNNKNYLLKYQPNKSVIELIINCYLKKNEVNSKYFLTPELFFINSDNSYFYIIEKYQTDLYKYFSLLEERNKIITFNDLIKITKFLMEGISILHKNNIIHCDLKLENIVLNYDENLNIIDLKIIDFDVCVFSKIPKNINLLSEKYEKILKNKKPRGTRIYMIKNKMVEFRNDIFSLGVILLILLYKNIKLMIFLKKRNVEKDDIIGYKKINIKYQSILKKITLLKDKIEENTNKKKILRFMENHLMKNKKTTFNFFEKNIDKFEMFKDLILDCINCNYDINMLKNKFINL